MSSLSSLEQMGSKFHAFMYPYFAFGHMIPYLHLANKLAEKGHHITFLLPNKAQKHLEPLNLFPLSIFFHPITLPPVEGLPVGAETTSDLPPNITGKVISDARAVPDHKLVKHLLGAKTWICNFRGQISQLVSTAELVPVYFKIIQARPCMDLLRDQIEAKVCALKPDLIFFDLVPWVPEMAKEFGVKSVSYQIVSAACVAISLSPGAELGFPQPSGYPSSKVGLRGHDANLYSIFMNSHKRFFSRILTGFKNCDVVSIRTCAEIEGKYCSFIERECQRKVFLTGPMFLETQEKSVRPLEDQWSHWLNGFEPGSVVFCALGSQTILENDQFQELCLGMELTGLPFLVAVKPPRGASTIQEALPQGFEERVKGRGIVWGGWVEQPLILSHQSVGCFVNHCGSGSMWESLVSDCQIVFIPQSGDQVLTTKLLSEEFEVSVKVEREDSGWFSKESLRDAVLSVMDKESEIGNTVKKNHMKLRETLASPGLLSGYADKFVEALETEVSKTSAS